MKRYLFSIDKVIFIQSSPPIAYDEVQHKMINEKIKELSIIVLAKDIKEAEEKIIPSLNEIVLYNFGDRENISNYKFVPTLVKVEEI